MNSDAIVLNSHPTIQYNAVEFITMAPEFITSGKQQWPFEELITSFLPLVPFFPFHVLMQNLPKAAKYKYRKVKHILSKEIQKE